VALIAFGFSAFVSDFVAVSAAKLTPLKARAVKAITKTLSMLFTVSPPFVGLDENA
jgi:hypothetical protein